MNRKQILIVVTLLTNFGNCFVMNPLGLNAGRTSGADSRDKIFTAALTGELIIGAAWTGNANTIDLRGIFYSTIANDLANVDGNKFYLTDSVNRYVASIEEASLIAAVAGRERSLDSLEYKRIFAPSLLCDVEEDGVLIGKPLPKL